MSPIPSSPVKKAKFKHSTPRKRNRIFASFSAGSSAKVVAEKEGVSISHVRGVVRRFTAQDYGISKPGRGRPPLLNEHDKRRILSVIAKDPFIQIETLRKKACPHVGRTCLSNHLKKWKISHHLAVTRPYLSNEHAASRYVWSLEHEDRPLSFWRTVLFTDESSIEKGGGGRRKWVFRPKGNCNPPFSFSFFSLKS